MTNSPNDPKLQEEIKALKSLFQTRFTPFDWDRAAVHGLSSFFAQQPRTVRDDDIKRLQDEVAALKKQVAPPDAIVSNAELQTLKSELGKVNNLEAKLEELLATSNGEGDREPTLISRLEQLVQEANVLKDEITGEKGRSLINAIIDSELMKLENTRLADKLTSSLDELHTKTHQRLWFTEAGQFLLAAVAVLAAPAWGGAAKNYDLPFMDTVFLCSITLISAFVGLAVVSKSARANRQRLAELENKKILLH